jgi:hypothetical protein
MSKIITIGIQVIYFIIIYSIIICLKLLSLSLSLYCVTQIRVGDKVFFGTNQTHNIYTDISLAKYDFYFTCAKGIADSLSNYSSNLYKNPDTETNTDINHKKPNYVYYLISDSLYLKRIAKAKYGDMLLTDTETLPSHWIYLTRNGNKNHTWNQLLISMKQSVIDMYLFSLMDYQIITTESGYGKVGSLIGSRNIDQLKTIIDASIAKQYVLYDYMLVYMIDKYQQETKYCHSNHPDNIEKLYSWSGL